MTGMLSQPRRAGPFGLEPEAPSGSPPCRPPPPFHDILFSLNGLFEPPRSCLVVAFLFGLNGPLETFPAYRKAPRLDEPPFFVVV